MSRDILFMLKPNLVENGRTYHCPDCSVIEGVLAYHPHVRMELEVHYLDFSRPRPPVIALLGEENHPARLGSRKSAGEDRQRAQFHQRRARHHQVPGTHIRIDVSALGSLWPS
jgi:hypothetical protein